MVMYFILGACAGAAIGLILFAVNEAGWYKECDKLLRLCIEQTDKIFDAWEEDVNALESEHGIVRCKDCVKHNVGFDDEWSCLDEVCPLVRFRGKSKGNEFDYQFCCYGKRGKTANEDVSRDNRN